MGDGPPGHVLTIVIPALNEEAAIGGTIERCLDARAHITGESAVNEVEIVVVSDGSSDRTEEIARSYDGVTVLVFEQNRGYGAAIKCGFHHGKGDLVGFLDADGTCDPKLFADLCRAIDDERADVVLGSRMGPQSEMPRLRRLGNTVFAWLLGLLSDHSVGDTASGMRVIRRDRLAQLYPLPDGLHFTPAMSARVLLEDKLKLVEVPMPYAERIGRSKLSVVRDGLRFFSVIYRAATCFRPARPLLLMAGLLAAMGMLLAFGPVVMYLRVHRLEEWMIYRILLAFLLATLTALLAGAAVVAERIAALAHERPEASAGIIRAAARLFSRGPRRVLGAVMIVAAVVVAWPGIAQYATTGQVEMHWSRAVLAALLLFLSCVLLVSTFLLNMLDLIQTQRSEGAGVKPPDRVHPAR